MNRFEEAFVSNSRRIGDIFQLFLRRNFLTDALHCRPFGLDRLPSEFLRQLPFVLHIQHEGLVALLPSTTLNPFNFGIQKMAGLAVEVETDQPNREAATAVRCVIMLFLHLS